MNFLPVQAYAILDLFVHVSKGNGQNWLTKSLLEDLFARIKFGQRFDGKVTKGTNLNKNEKEKRQASLPKVKPLTLESDIYAD